MIRTAVLLAAVCCVMFSSALADEKTEQGWVSIFDGTMKGWKANENTDSWKIEDGAFVCQGPRSHLFYVGKHQPLVDFEWKADVMTKPGSNSGMYFHTQYQESGWPKYGYEAQVNNTQSDPKRTGSLYAVKNVFEAPAKDNTWFTQHVIVKGRRIIIKVDGKTLVDYTEPVDKKPGKDFTRKLDKGTFALQAHDPGSRVYFKNLRIKPGK